MRTLIAFPGPKDPYILGLIGGEKQPGPILWLTMLNISFERIILLAAQDTLDAANSTAEAIRAHHARIKCEIRPLPIDSLADFQTMIHPLRAEAERIGDEYSDDDMFIAAAPDLPDVHACWALLVSEGTVDATLLKTSPPLYPTDARPRIPLAQASPTPDLMDTSEAPARQVLSDRSMSTMSVARNRRASDISAQMAQCGRVQPSATAPEAYRRPAALGDAMQELGIIGEAPSMAEALKMAHLAAASDSPVLLQGETGTGKEMFARLIHRLSARSGRAIEVINCSSIPEALIESHLFGHRRGAFTGATEDRPGKFVEADGGTLFLDEIGDMPILLQPRLLRILEDGMVEPVGGGSKRRVYVRIIAATKVNLQKAVEKSTFRDDLFFRLNYLPIRLPPLRDRRDDIPRITLHLLAKINATTNRPRQLTRQALNRLQEHEWRGNVRELAQILRRTLVLNPKETLDADDLMIETPPRTNDPLAALPNPRPGFSLEEFLRSVRKQLMLRALELAQGNQSGAARLLGITPQAVHQFLRTADGECEP